MPSISKGLYDNVECLIISRVSLISTIKFLAEVRNKVTLLTQDSGYIYIGRYEAWTWTQDTTRTRGQTNF